jgi:hypothetical protein
MYPDGGYRMMSKSADETEKKWDIAISFLIQDINIAEALYDKLSVGFTVFFSPRRQEEIAGTDGIEIFRQTFLAESRLNVVVYRERWGQTPWTAVEAAAIKDSCVLNQFRNIFVFNVENTHVFPPWLPHTHMRFDLGEYTLDQVIGAIKLRVAEQGGHYQPLTPLKRAELLRAEQEYEWDRSSMRSQDGIGKILGQTRELFAEIDRQCADVRAHGHLDIECEVNQQTCLLRFEGVGMIVIWHQLYSNTLDHSGLSVDEYAGHLRFNRDRGPFVHFQNPDHIKHTDYEPELSRSREYGWKLAGKSAEFIPTNAMAEKCVMQFMDLIDRERNGKLL